MGMCTKDNDWVKKCTEYKAEGARPRETHTHTHNRFTAHLEFVWDHPGEQVPER